MLLKHKGSRKYFKKNVNLWLKFSYYSGGYKKGLERSSIGLELYFIRFLKLKINKYVNY